MIETHGTIGATRDSHRAEGRRERNRCDLMVLGILVLSTLSCAPIEKKVGETVTTRIRDPFLSKHVETRVTKESTNAQTGLFEVDVSIVTDSLDARHPNSFRIMVRALYYQGAAPQPVDTSQWSEFLIQPGQPVELRSASLTPADRCLIEVAYPEEVGLK